MGNSNEEYLERGRQRLREGAKRLERVKLHTVRYDLLVDLAGDELEIAASAYGCGTEKFGGDSIEAWEKFNKYCEDAISDLRCAIKELHSLAEIIPSDVDPKRIRSLETLIDRIVNTRIDFWDKWGKRMVKEEHDRVMALERWTCAALQVAGIPHADMESEAGEAYCRNGCKYR